MTPQDISLFVDFSNHLKVNIMDIQEKSKEIVHPIFKQDLFLINEKVYASVDFLNNCGISSNKVYKRKYNTLQKGYGYWKTIVHPLDSRMRLVEYESIPKEFIENYKMPDKWQIFRILHKENHDLLIQQKRKLQSEIKLILDFAYHHKFKFVRELYANEIIGSIQVDKYCKTDTVLTSCIGLIGDGHTIKNIFEVYKTYDELTFKTNQYSSFANKISKLKSGIDVKSELLHSLRKRVSNNLKLQDDVMVEIRRLYSLPKKLNATQITENVNEYLILRNRNTISQKSVEKVIRIVSIRNECMLSRHGRLYTTNKLYPYASFVEPERTGEIWMMDGSRFQFIYKTPEKNFNFLTFFVVIDGCSRKVIGYSYDGSENGEMVSSAFQMACKNTNYLPNEIVHDNSSAIIKGRFSRIREISDLWGVYWHSSHVQNPKENSYAERFFGVFQETFCKKKFGYIGEGITSKRINGRPSKEELTKLSKQKNIRTKDQLVELLVSLINEYNSTPGKLKMSPNKIHDIKERSKVINLSIDRYVMLFWEEKEITIRNSTIFFIHKKETFIYIIENTDLIVKYNGIKVLVKYNPENPKIVYVFNIETSEYITYLERYIELPKAKIARSEEEEKRLRDFGRLKRNITTVLKKKQLEIENASDKNWSLIPPEISEYSIVSKKNVELAENKFWSDSFTVNSKRKKIEDDYELVEDVPQNTSIKMLYSDLYNY